MYSRLRHAFQWTLEGHSNAQLITRYCIRGIVSNDSVLIYLASNILTGWNIFLRPSEDRHHGGSSWSPSLNPSVISFRDVWGGFRGVLTGPPWCRQALYSVVSLIQRIVGTPDVRYCVDVVCRLESQRGLEAHVKRAIIKHAMIIIFFFYQFILCCIINIFFFYQFILIN